MIFLNVTDRPDLDGLLVLELLSQVETIPEAFIMPGKKDRTWEQNMIRLIKIVQSVGKNSEGLSRKQKCWMMFGSARTEFIFDIEC